MASDEPAVLRTEVRVPRSVQDPNGRSMNRGAELLTL